MSSDTENKAVQAVQTVQLTQVVSESEYHLDSAHTVEPVHSFPLPQQHDVFIYLAQFPPQDD